ncbi:metal ABC transporter substrate-binding protein [Candidatus Nitrosopelagicus sp.]|nr:metal ABC transporter substrate-binding protein [Candidatus Nitrosopelagicus sp.]
MNIQIKLAIIAIVVVITLASLAVSQTNLNSEISTTDNSKLQIVTSAGFLHEFSQNIGKEKIDSFLLIPMGINPHDWEPTIRDTERLEKSDMIIINGLGYENWVSSLDLSNYQGIIVDTSNGISIEHDEHDEHAKEDEHDEHANEDEHDDDSHIEEFYEEIASVIEEFEHGHMTELQSIEAIEEILHEHEGDGHGHGIGAIEDIEHLLHEIEDGHIEGSHGLEEIHHLVSGEDVHDEHAKEDDHDGHDHGGQDPHIWLNPVYAQLQAKNIANALSNSDPMNKNYYQSNAEIYIKELDLLDSKIRTELSGCRSDFITFHDAFSYFAEEYGLTQHTIVASTDPHGDVTPKTLEKIISTAKKLNIKIIFAEESTSTKTSQVIADEIGGKVLVLSPLEIVSNEENYVSKMTKNLENLSEALC